MDAHLGRCARISRVKPLAACLALALAVGSQVFAISDVHATIAPATPGPGKPRTPHISTTNEGARAVAREWSRTHQPPSRPATITAVTNCNDAGAGSLRDEMAAAVDGDTIDLTTLACSLISLNTGALTTTANNLTINGPGASALTIDAGLSNSFYNSAVYHFGTGTIALNDMTITDAKYTGNTNPTGGCIYSTGAVYLSGSTVSRCYLYTSSSTSDVRGAAIFSQSGVSVKYSNIIGNAAISNANNVIGGGIYTGGGLITKYSTVDSNFAISLTTGYTFGGGAITKGSATIIGSTFSNNYARNIGALIINGGSAYTASIGNSTFSGNTAANVVGAIYVNAPLTMQSTTITGNTSGPREGCLGYGYYCSGGLQMRDAVGNLQSTIAANNLAGALIDDVSTGGTGDVSSGANNLVRFADALMPADTIYADPLLLPLTNNGGLTKTHALMASSLAINAGNNANNANYDQRGLGFARVVGANADIGAFELQGPNDGDFIFINGFDP